jgi:hypothetical protein
MVTAGLGWKKHDYIRYSEARSGTDSYGNPLWVASYDTLSLGWLSMCFDYRLGVLDRHPFGQGVEIGFHLEQSLRSMHDTFYVYTSANDPPYEPVDSSAVVDRYPIADSPPVLELNGRVGLPDAVLGDGLYHHNIELGWIVGGWVDNGWFAGYCAGWEREHIMPYGGARVVLTPTDVLNRSSSPGDGDFFTEHDRSWHVRLTAGMAVSIPRLPVLPDYVSPEISVYAPNHSKCSPIGFAWNVGLRWVNGR